MRAVIQRVSSASVRVDGEVVGEIDHGLLVLLGVAPEDGPAQVDWMVRKITHLRIFADDRGRFDRSVADVQGGVLVVSQFTLFGDCRKGRRPNFSGAAHPELAEPLWEQVCAGFEAQGLRVGRGRFAADMKVSLLNDGPVTLVLDTPA